LLRALREEIGIGRSIARTVNSFAFQLAARFSPREPDWLLQPLPTRLRLRRALERLVASERFDRARRSIFGFSSHSHFHQRFHRASASTLSECDGAQQTETGLAK